MTPFFPCPFLCASPCPPPLSPPCLSVHVGLWLPSAKNSVCHLRSAFAVLHLCHQTHTGSSGCGQALLRQVTTNKNAFIFRALKIGALLRQHWQSPDRVFCKSGPAGIYGKYRWRAAWGWIQTSSFPQWPVFPSWNWSLSTTPNLVAFVRWNISLEFSKRDASKNSLSSANVNRNSRNCFHIARTHPVSVIGCLFRS